MMPAFPLIAIHELLLVDLVPSELDLQQVSTLHLIRQPNDRYTYFDRNGQCWKLTRQGPHVNPTFFRKLLAYTVFNPVVTVQCEWNLQRAYEFDELKKRLQQCIAADDDTLTQLVEKEDLCLLLEKCTRFTEVTDMLRDYVFEPVEEKIEAFVLKEE